MIPPASCRALWRALALAAAVALGSPLASAPAYAALERTTTAEDDGAVTPPAVPSPAPDPAAGASAAGASADGASAAGLAEAVARDLGMTLEEFNAAGEQGKRAAAERAVPETPAAPATAAPKPGTGNAAAGQTGKDLRAASVEQLYRA